MSDQLELDFGAQGPVRRATRKRPTDPKAAERLKALRERYGRKSRSAASNVISLDVVRQARGLKSGAVASEPSFRDGNAHDWRSP